MAVPKKPSEGSRKTYVNGNAVPRSLAFDDKPVEEDMPQTGKGQPHKPTTKPVAKPASKPAAKPVAKPAARAAAKPATKPSTKPALKQDKAAIKSSVPKNPFASPPAKRTRARSSKSEV